MRLFSSRFLQFWVLKCFLLGLSRGDTLERGKLFSGLTYRGVAYKHILVEEARGVQYFIAGFLKDFIIFFFTFHCLHCKKKAFYSRQQLLSNLFSPLIFLSLKILPFVFVMFTIYFLYCLLYIFYFCSLIFYLILIYLHFFKILLQRFEVNLKIQNNLFIKILFEDFSFKSLTGQDIEKKNP